jgi:hypothetical protein
VQVPEATSEIVQPPPDVDAEVQTEVVVDVTVTGRPDEAWGPTDTDPVLMGWLGIKEKDPIVCEYTLTAKLTCSGGAGATVAEPGWVNAMVHVPAATKVASPFDTEHTEGVFEAELTGSPEVA